LADAHDTSRRPLRGLADLAGRAQQRNDLPAPQLSVAGRIHPDRRCRQFLIPNVVALSGTRRPARVLVPRVHNRESELLYRVDAALRDDGHEGHAALQQIVRGLHGFLPCMLNDLKNAFRATGLALDDKHVFRTAQIGMTRRLDFMDVKAAQAIGETSGAPTFVTEPLWGWVWRPTLGAAATVHHSF
jgi:hypothetical protein